ncbi:hypothetical protein BDZ85DRAFT_272054 [Elsinoe ampelina]|uniref:NAD-dependent epimerase/dehydratase domain-containing protein n=1 Tax=Elsinoe ampelina TaxID=302913 RepID=A0A6A6GMW6_9PEZI|nr:hypothetical protein BDZ85DRAFT_272054 [Elsinoe ampelina]
MGHNILITGGSGYLGGTLLARWKEAKLTGYEKLFALVRKPDQAEAVKRYGCEPLTFDMDDAEAVKDAIATHSITIVFFLVDAFKSGKQVNFIKALAEVKKNTGKDVHFLHTTGAKMFSSLAGAPTDKPWLDSDTNIFEIHKSQKAPPATQVMQIPVQTNITITEEGDEYGVKTYILAPCIVYGKGEGFGNIISIQTVDVVTAAKALGQVYKLRDDRPVGTYPPRTLVVLTIQDMAGMPCERSHGSVCCREILEGRDIDSGKDGFYLASSGLVVWDDLYDAMAKALVKQSVVKDASVKLASREERSQIAKALGVPEERVEFNFSGRCTYTAARGKKYGWTPQYEPQHILEDAENEVDLILQNLKGK